MRILFLISDTQWSGRARAFASAARGLKLRGHEVFVACDAECPTQVRIARGELDVVPLSPNATAAGDTLQLRRALQQRGVDVVFVHSDAEHLTAGSALRLGGGSAAVIRRVGPFEPATNHAGGRLATHLAPSGLLFSTEADRQSAGASRHRLPALVAPVGVDVTEHDAVAAATRGSLGVPAEARLIVCVYDGADKRRVLTAMRTLALLAPRHPELHLAVVGLPHMDELRMHGAALGVNPMMTLLGTRDDELAVVRAADVGWVAADGDAAAFAALDFMAMRVPVLAERTPLTEHYVADGIAGVLLSPADPATTAAAVAAFLAKTGQHPAMGNAGRARLQREFPFDAMIDGFEQAANAAAQHGAQPVG